MAISFFEVRIELASIDHWRSYLSGNDWLRDPAYIESAIQSIRETGLEDPVLGWVPPVMIEIKGTNYRETIAHDGLNSRLRAVLLELVGGVGTDVDIYAPEAVTGFAKRLRRMFPRFVGSEYLPNPADRAVYPGIAHQDVQALSFEDESFDVYVSCEIIEHVPDVAEVLHEARRVLKPNGVFVATFPFSFGSATGTEKSRLLTTGEIEHCVEPEFHGNPVGEGSLVFSIPGWNILEACRNAGFADAQMIARSSRRFGIVGRDLACVLLLRAVA